ncbi:MULTISPECIES: CvfB family protein [Vibrio]|jgi:predicted RNA-binding protein (virulence factor B family)|uniref:GntR family transcriptional regulator n=3 Tax=Vibrio TaxID=662 RepID=A0AAP3D286_9VIBR|nr:MULTISPECIES: S1-like domain-containing RNA-binding protein [Vibrio]KOY47529.1 GntR family transcriptional regulator [Vibrio parahaemolyticus]MCR9493833.1 S1-like domain-containing RNA-binding protein [Vibrio alginolyticus]AVF60198.1 GntR family transcriptional regulator [Vibrio diabolicus]EMD77999.1 nucleic acid binding protein [Vibrio diabolicus E0666]KAB0317035.1 GntR family transcriptional regulator [Vibrio diabolicus]|eukprot:NODE_1579_length_1677_cov_25.562420_g1501_i0.p1 GENE.NODE_1579_length_1677_cov_25.562420_g1501_i0~~NODE_1579_length_1677_cov_25.562420_g1501_i0.p1  ORF type:complete len:278 (-),score=18.51 NODE_1579_length_1677_cov_25.562420_g1501_i0:472-1305(-)
MIKIGQINSLEVIKKADFGVFLDGDDYGSVLLPNKYVPEGTEIGDHVDVFLYFDSESQLAATIERPIAQVGEWGLMKIEGVNATGAFVNWGIKEKDLLIPFSEQRTRFSAGQTILVYVYTDKASGRIVGTTKFNKWLDKTPANYEVNEQVDLIIAERSQLGYKAIVNGKHWGMIFPSDVFGKLYIGKKLKGFIKQIREDGKIDLALQKVGVAKMDDLSSKILDLLEKKGGFLPLNDKSSPEAIFDAFRTSKGTYKKTIGGLYKQGKIVIEKDGIRLA